MLTKEQLLLERDEWDSNLTEMIDAGTLDVMELKANSFMSEAKLQKRNHRYYDGDIPITVSRNTLFHYEPGRYSPGKQIAGIFLKNVIPQDVQDTAFNVMEGFKWQPPTRVEIMPAIHRQRGKEVAAKELHAGYSHYITIEKSTLLKKQGEQFAKLGEFLLAVDEVFRQSLRAAWCRQNTPLPMGKREQELAEENIKQPFYGGIPPRFRLLLSCFSGIAMLKSCPAAIHKDRNGRQGIENFSCLASLGKNFTGGGFCLIEYGVKIPVRPGDVLICQSSREWHCNMGAVRGLKYSLVCYYQNPIASPKFRIAKDVPRDPTLEAFLAMSESEQKKEVAKYRLFSPKQVRRMLSEQS